MNQSLVSAILRFYPLFPFSSSLFFFSFLCVSSFSLVRTSTLLEYQKHYLSSKEYVRTFALGHGAD